MLLTFWKVEQRGRRSAAQKQQQAQATATGTQATRKGRSTVGGLKATQQNQEQNSTNNNREIVRAVRRKIVPRRVPEEGWEPDCGGPNLEKVGPEGWAPPRVGFSRVGARVGPKFRAFFSFYTHFHSFFLSLGVFSCLSSSLWVFSWNFGGVWSVGTSNVLVFALRLSCGSPRRPAGRRGLHSQIKKSKNQQQNQKIAKQAKRKKIKSKYCSNKKK